MSRLAVRLGIAAFVLVGAAACHHHRPHVETVRGPDGGTWKLAECDRMDKRCYDVAQRTCPNGFYMAKNPVDRSSPPAERREAQAADENATAISPKPGGGNVTTLPPTSQWSDDMYSRRRGKILFRCAGDAADPHS